MSIRIDGITEPFLCYDAHIDHPGEGGWGSLEQLEGLQQLDGGIRVFFCEPNGGFHTTVPEHLRDMDRIYREMQPGMPEQWKVGRDVLWCVEGLESLQNENEVYACLSQLSSRMVKGIIPLYHVGNPLGGCSKEPGKGLSNVGMALIKQMWKRGWWVDLAHMSHVSMGNAFVARDTNDQRICYSHGGIWHSDVTEPLILNGNRERLISLNTAIVVAREGLVCVSPAQPFYNRIDGAFIEHIKLLGEESEWKGVGIGTDYGGILDQWRLPGCRTIAECFTTVIETLLDAGLEEWQVRRVVGLNVRDFFLTAR